MFCPYCGAKIGMKDRFCPECGAEVERERMDSALQTESSIPVSDSKEIPDFMGSEEDLVTKTTVNKITKNEKKEIVSKVDVPKVKKKKAVTPAQQSSSSDDDCCGSFCCCLIFLGILFAII